MRMRKLLMVALGGALILALGACQQGGINKDDAALIRQQLDDVASRLGVVETRLQDLAGGSAGNEQLISQVRTELKEARTTLADVEDRLAASEPATIDENAAPADDGGLGTTPNQGLGTTPNQGTQPLPQPGM